MNESVPAAPTITLDEAIRLGVQLHRSGELSAAEDLFRQILHAIPEQPDALHFLGLLLHQSGRSDEAIKVIQRAIAAAPRHVDAHNNLGNMLKERGHLEEAEVSFRKAIDMAPEHAAAHNNLGVVLREKGRLDEALSAYARAIDLQADFLDAHINRGHVLAEQGRLSEAAAAYMRVIALAPHHAGAYFQLGRLHRREKRKAEALVAFRQAIAIQPQHAAAHFQLGNTLVEDGLLQNAEEALAGYRHAILCDRSFSKAYENLGNLLNLLGRGDEATLVWRQWRESEPDHPIARHMTAATTGLQPGRAEDGYVKQTFDDFAPLFDERLRQLHYRAPELVAEELARQLGPPAGDLTVLDAGCGTGWCGPLLRPYARLLAGVDLSAGMLEQARARGGYEELVEAELTEFLARTAGRYDVIACADTLVYFGDLSPILRAARTALRPGGCFVFTLECLGPGADAGGFRLHPTGRYAHAEDYVRKALADAGLSVRCMTCSNLRMEGGKPVMGFVVAAGNQPAV